jgi:uncharacterized membrane protein HdeD (DUF308 family)
MTRVTGGGWRRPDPLEEDRSMLSFSAPISRGHAAFRGFIALALGVVFLVWPNITIGTAVVLFAVFCFMDAIASLARLFSAGDTAGDRVLQILRTVVDVAAGIVAIVYPGPTALVLTIIIGVYLIFGGILELSGSGMLARFAMGGTGWLVVGGLLSIAAGVLIVVWPDIGVVTLAIVFGAYLAAYGIAWLISAAMAPKSGTVADPLTS